MARPHDLPGRSKMGRDELAGKLRRIPVDEQCEVLSLIGDIASGDDGPSLHAHVVLGLADGTTRGGHLLEGRVFPTLEVVVTETPAELRKVARPELGTALIDLPASSMRSWTPRGAGQLAPGGNRAAGRRRIARAAARADR